MYPSQAPLSLSQLIDQIDQVKTLSEQLDLYERQLVSNKQFTVPRLVPVLTERITRVNTDFSQSRELFDDANSLMRSLRTELDSTFSLAGNLLNIATAMDDTLIYKQTRDFLEQFEGFQESCTGLFDVTLDEYFQITTKVDIQAEYSRHLTIDQYIRDGTETETWVIRKIQACAKQLHSDMRILSLKSLRRKIVSEYERLNGVSTLAHDLNELIIRKKALNPLISDEMVNSAQAMTSAFSSLHSHYNTWIHGMYVHSNQVEMVDMSIEIYRLLAAKITLSESEALQQNSES